MKKIIGAFLISFGLILLSGCAQAPNKNKNTESEVNKENNQEETKVDAAFKKCQEEKVSLPNYGDPGKRLKNCFVEFPGEPSRQDKSYYIVEDICGQFTQEFMENMLGEKLAKIEPPKINGIYNCTYYFNEKDYIIINLEYLKIENQKKGNEMFGLRNEKSAQIPMDNLMATREDGVLDVIYLVLSPDKFISFRPNSKNTIDNDKFIKLVSNIGGAIKNYK